MKTGISKSEIVFIVCLFIGIILKTVHYELLGKLSVLLYPIAILPLLAAIIIILLITAIMIFKTKKKTVFPYLLSSLLLFLPLDEGYEKIRFMLLRPEMERVAIEIAKEYQNKENRTINIYNIELPDRYKYLSRGKTVNCILYPEGIEVAFYKWPGLMDHSMQYIYTTNIPYNGLRKYNSNYCGGEAYWLEYKPIAAQWSYLKTG